MMDSFVDTTTKGKGKEKSYNVAYVDLTQAQVEKTMADQVEHISGIFGVEVSADLQGPHMPIFCLTHLVVGHCELVAEVHGLE